MLTSKARTICFYRTHSGKSPVREFLDSLSAEHARKVVWVLKLIEDVERVPVTFFKKLVSTDGLWEIRISAANSSYRLLCFFDGSDVVVACHAFSKKTQKLRRRDIALAQQRKTDYFNRKG